MKYKYELHCHTGDVSVCGHVPAAALVARYRAAGYSGVVITDHYSPMTFTGLSHIRPQDYPERYLAGYRAAKQAAGPDFTVLLGMELRFYATWRDYLVYGVDEAFLTQNGNLMAKYIRRFSALAKESGLIVVQAHPFRPPITRCAPRFLDGAEVYNAKDRHTDRNARALQWAEQEGLAVLTSGSDFHRQEDALFGGIETEEPIFTNEDLKRILLSGDYKLLRDGKADHEYYSDQQKTE